MPNPIPLNFGTTTDLGRAGQDAGAAQWNAVLAEVKGGSHPAPIYADYGWEIIRAAANVGAFRGGIVLGGFIYALLGTSLVKIDPSGVSQTVGGIAGTARAVFAANDIAVPQIAVTVNGEKFVVQGDTISPINDPDIPSSNSCTYLNQKIIYLSPDGQFSWSSITDATDVSALDFATAEGNRDGGVRIIAHLQELWIFGTETIEIWTDTGDGFRRRGGTVIPKGCVGTHTVAALDRDLFWVGNDNVVYMATGYGFTRISTHEIEELIRDTPSKSNLVAWTYFEGGHAFYVLSSPTWTRRFNRAYGNWSIKQSYGLPVWMADTAFQLDNDWFFGSSQDDSFFKANHTNHKEGSTSIVWRARSAPMHAYPNQMSVSRLHLNLLTGVGVQSSDIHQSEPKIGLRFSDDGGQTWSNQRFQVLGQQGKKTTQVTFEGLGETGTSGRIWEIESSSPVVRGLMHAAIEAEPSGT